MQQQLKFLNGSKHMRLIKAFLTGAIGLFIVITLLSLLIPSNVKVSRTTLINNTTKGKVFEQVDNLSNWKNWHPVFKNADSKINMLNEAGNSNPSAEILYGNKSAKLIITSADSNAIKFNLQSPGENDIQNEIIISTIPQQANVQVEWRAFNHLKWYPWEKFYGIFIDKLTGPGYEQSLKSLKDYLETGR
jgi:hypothetical protein